MLLRHFAEASNTHRAGVGGLEGFLADPTVAALDWPDEVKEQWLYDHAGSGHFEADYGALELSRIVWKRQVLPIGDFMEMPTGRRDASYLEEVSSNPQHWISTRKFGIHSGVREMWERRGTWMRPPLVVDRRALAPGTSGWQLVEGRTRVGILRGLYLQGEFVASEHVVWLGRLRPHVAPEIKGN